MNIFDLPEGESEPDDAHRLFLRAMLRALSGEDSSGETRTFENALLEAGVPVRHIEENVNVPMYRTTIACQPAGRFHGPMVVSMRPMTASQYATAANICGKLPLAHGAPIHHGDPAALGIADVARPDFGDAVTLRPGEQPAFWACGVTPQAALMAARPPFAITHKPGHMFLTDLRDSDLRTG